MPILQACRMEAIPTRTPVRTKTEIFTQVTLMPARRALFSLEPTAYTLLPYFVLRETIIRMMATSRKTKKIYGIENVPNFSFPVPNCMRRNW